MIQFHLKVSKCDQFGSGAYVVVGRTGCQLCPVQALLEYMGPGARHQAPSSSTAHNVQCVSLGS